MIKLTITNSTTHLPLKFAKGSAKVRTNKAQKMNAKLYENMKSAFSYGEISPGILKTMIQNITGKKIKIKTIPINTQKSRLALSATQKGTISGYEIHIPTNPVTARIPQEYAGTILCKTFELFSRILNPKINTREIKFMNRHNFQSYPKFMSEIFSTKPLKKVSLEKFLGILKTEEKINLLQIIRNQIKIQTNGHKEGNKYQQKLNSAFKRYHSKYNEQVHYDKFDLEEKLKLIEETLAATLKNERAKLVKQ